MPKDASSILSSEGSVVLHLLEFCLRDYYHCRGSSSASARKSFRFCMDHPPPATSWVPLALFSLTPSIHGPFRQFFTHYWCHLGPQHASRPLHNSPDPPLETSSNLASTVPSSCHIPGTVERLQLARFSITRRSDFPPPLALQL